MQTASQIARNVLTATIREDGGTSPINHDLVYRWVERGILMDRVQREMEV